MHYAPFSTAVALVLIGQVQAADNQAITEQMANLSRIEASQRGFNLSLSVYQGVRKSVDDAGRSRAATQIHIGR